MSGKEESVLAKPTPYAVELEPGKEYWYCTCGKSKNQPFCDGNLKFNDQVAVQN